MPATATGWLAVGAMTAAGTGAYMAVESRRASKKAEKLAEKQMGFQERQAGEYYTLTKKQMELQAQESNIKTLADIIESTKKPQAPQFYQLPPAKEYSPIDEINRAIDKMFRG